MDLLVNTALSLLLIAVAIVQNAFKCKKHSIHRRLVHLGSALFLGIGLCYLLYAGFIPAVPLNIVIFGIIGWTCALFFLSFLMDLTSQRRPFWFPFVYLLPVVLGLMNFLVPQLWGRRIIGSIGLCIVFVCSLIFVVSWIRAGTDDRARRDGEWLLLVFIAFSVGLIICIFRALSGIFWVISLWYLTLHIVVNYLKLLQQLTDPENLLIIDNVFDIVVILDASGRIVRLNRRGIQLSGFSPNVINGNGIEKFVSHVDLSASSRKQWLEKNSWVDNGHGPGRSPSIDAMIIMYSGEKIPVDLHIICLVDLAKKHTGYIVSASDMRITHQLMKEISDREYATRDLALSESKFSRMFIFNPTGILIVDLDTLKITDANPAIEEIFECDTKALVGRQLSDIGLEMFEMPYANFIEKIQMEGSVPEFSANIKLGPQQAHRCRLSAVSFDINQTRNMLLSVADVTQQEQMREALDRKQKVETIGILAGGIAHDFNNILAVILGHIGLAKMRIVDAHARLPIEKAEQACLRAREMTRQLLAFSRGGKPVIASCETRQLIIDSAMLAVSDTSVACLFDIEKTIWPLMVDKIQVGQVIANLITNAVDAMGKSGIIEISARNFDLTNTSARKRPAGIDSKPLSSGPWVEIKIKDQGPGIPDSIRSKIFDPFFTTKEKGTGLGLSIVFSVIQNHEGSINVLSSPGEGAIFTICLPADPETAQKNTAPDFSILPGKKKVLLMDDDAQVRETARGILSSFGYNLTETENGPEAIKVYDEAYKSGQPFDFCILDLVIPGGMSGSDCAKEIHRINPSALLLVSSGYSNDPVLSEPKDYGFSGVIAKPYTYEEFRQVLLKVLVL